MSFVNTLINGHQGGLAHEGMTPMQKIALRFVVLGVLYYGLAAIEGMMMRVVNTFLDVSVNWRERMLVNMFRNQLADGLKERNGAYWTIKTPTTNLAWDGFKASPAQLKLAADMATRLKKFPIDQQRAAVLAGYSYADGTIRRFVMPEAPAPAAAPVLP